MIQFRTNRRRNCPERGQSTLLHDSWLNRNSRGCAKERGHRRAPLEFQIRPESASVTRAVIRSLARREITRAGMYFIAAVVTVEINGSERSVSLEIGRSVVQ